MRKLKECYDITRGVQQVRKQLAVQSKCQPAARCKGKTAVQSRQIFTAGRSEEVETYRDGKYTDDMRQCCMPLLAMNVGIENVGPVIAEVLKLADRRPSKVPSYRLLQQMVTEGWGVSFAQTGEVAAGASEATTLHYDSTSKFGRKYMGFS